MKILNFEDLEEFVDKDDVKYFMDLFKLNPHSIILTPDNLKERQILEDSIEKMETETPFIEPSW